MLLRLVSATVVAGALAVPTAAVAVVEDDTAARVAASQQRVMLATAAATGFTRSHDGTPLDNVAVVAADPATGEAVASALSYGGEYTLHLPAGTYDLTYSLADHETHRSRLSVGEDLLLPDVVLLREAPQALSAPTVTGTARVGRVLEVDPGTWDVDELTYRYQWRLDGSPLAGATAPWLRVHPRHFRGDLSVTVTATKPGWVTARATSASVTVRAARFALDVDPPRRVGERWRVPVNVAAPRWAGPDGTASLCTPVRCIRTRVVDGRGTAYLPATRRSTRVTVTFRGPRAYAVPAATFMLRGR